jgi:hypothetical protein
VCVMANSKVDYRCDIKGEETVAQEAHTLEEWTR